MRQQPTIRRVFASAMLATLALSLVGASLSAGLAGTRDCPLAPASDSHRAALISAMPDGACDHSDAGPCLGALGCVTAAPAIALMPTWLLVPAELISVGIGATPRLGDLYRAGPPTPPPNQI